jgi:hypothetical protein
MSKQVEKWEEEFEKKFGGVVHFKGTSQDWETSGASDDLKDFIRQTLLADRKERDRELAEKVKEMWGYPCSCERKQEFCTHDYNAMHAVLSLLSPDINHNER